MGKPLCLVQAAIATRSGYGEHSRDLVRSLIKMYRFDVHIWGTRWGETSYIPDHQGASPHVCENAGPEDVVVAMDLLIHWSYCPRADFQLTLSPKGDAEGWIGIRSGSFLDAMVAAVAKREAPRVWIVLAGQKTRTQREEPGDWQVEKNR